MSDCVKWGSLGMALGAALMAVALTLWAYAR